MAVKSGTNNSIFIKKILSKVFRAQDVVSRPQSDTPTIKAFQIGKNTSNITLELHFLLWGVQTAVTFAIHFLLLGVQTAVTFAINHSIYSF